MTSMDSMSSGLMKESADVTCVLNAVIPAPDAPKLPSSVSL
jgi:hypothetical protein